MRAAAERLGGVRRVAPLPLRLEVVVLLLVLLVVVGLGVASAASVTEERRTVAGARPPQLSEEEEKSLAVPPRMRCDACRAVARVVAAELAEESRLRHRGKRVPEHAGFDALERVCGKKGAEKRWAAYGCAGAPPPPLLRKGGAESLPPRRLVEVDGENVLAGPGIPERVGKEDADAPVSLVARRGGGLWPHRLRERCAHLVDAATEEAVLAAHARNGEDELRRAMCKTECTAGAARPAEAEL